MTAENDCISIELGPSRLPKAGEALWKRVHLTERKSKEQTRKLEIQVRYGSFARSATASCLWASGFELARWIFGPGQPDVLDKMVLELGCGLGLASLLAISVGAKHVLATDVNLAVLDNLEESAAAMGLDACWLQEAGGKTETLLLSTLDFCSFQDISKVSDAWLSLLSRWHHQNFGHHTHWDLVIFSDCVYSETHGELLARALCTLLTTDAAGRTKAAQVVGAFPTEHRTGVEKFWNVASELGLSWREVTVDSERPLFGHVFRFKATASTSMILEEMADETMSVEPLFSDLN